MRINQRGQGKGFTLIELLVVITIIGVLASMSFVAATAMKRRAEDVQCKNTIVGLQNAISTYFTEYRRLPLRDIKGPESAGNPILTEEKLMNVLLGSDDERKAGGLNPRGKLFLEGSKTAKPDGKGSYRNGVKSNSSGGGELFDPWGNPYRVVFDMDNNDRIRTPSWDSGEWNHGAVLIWSAGRDGLDNEAADNQKSW